MINEEKMKIIAWICFILSIICVIVSLIMKQDVLGWFCASLAWAEVLICMNIHNE